MSGRLRRWLVLGIAVLGLVLGAAQARTVRIVTADRLELRTVDEQEIVVISGDRVELRVDDDVIVAGRVEYNRTTRTLTLIGDGSYVSQQNGSRQVLRGNDLVVDLSSQALTGEDVLVSDASLEIRGAEVQRVPGQLTAQSGYFTPCARCGRTPNDYAFRAGSILLYPGDRLVAYGATLLLADTPVLYLPVVVLPLQDQSRVPRLSVANDAVDGFTVAADLPFVVGSSALGTTLLRYYQHRSPALGFGVDLHAYAPVTGVDRLDLYGLASPRPLVSGNDADGNTVYTAQPGYEYDLNFSVKGSLNLASTASGLTYQLTATRADIGRSADDPERGVTNVNGTASADLGGVNLQANYVDRLGPAPTTSLPTVLRRPEVVIDPKPYQLGKLSADFRVTLGRYTAASNPLSRSASAQGLNFSTSRLEENHVITYTATPWKNATFSFSNTFTGRYYLTGARVVDLNIGGSLTQTFSVSNTVRLGYVYSRLEGTSPFAFDAVYSRAPSGVLSTDVSVSPATGATVTAAQSYDFVQPRQRQQAASIGVSVQKAPVSFSLNLKPNFFRAVLESVDVNAVVGQNLPLVVGLRAGYTELGGPGTLALTADAIGGPRSNTFGVTLNYDLKQHLLSSVNLRANALSTQDAVLNPVAFSASETINLQTPTQLSSLNGTASVTWRDLVFSSAHSLTLPAGNRGSDTLNFSVSNVAGSLLSWRLNYGGPYDLTRLGWTTPALTGNVSATRPGQRLSAQVTVSLPGLDQNLVELSNASVAATYNFGSRASLNGGAYYARTRSGTGTAAQQITDSLTFQPLTLTLALGKLTRPDAYLSTTLRQTLTWQNGVLQAPGRLEPIVLLTVDRCCWALQVELNPVDRRFRIGIGLPGSAVLTAFEADPNGPSVPLLQPNP
ncbi:hypothetical protein [Deinococcus sonorensis]|uniref:LPS-assembly protein LptD n=2 Tax=Deinococcus sonorensis TaxID=309891 RepID=A0AAU7UDG8_9DEIO